MRAQISRFCKVDFTKVTKIYFFAEKGNKSVVQMKKK